MMPESPDRPSAADLRKGVAAACIAAVWGAIFLFVLVHSLPHNPVGGAIPDRIGIRIFIPEGWAFFTKDPRDRQFQVFSERGGRWVPAMRMPVARPGNLFGIDRAARAQGVELGMILQKVPDAAWAECASDDAVCLRAASADFEIRNDLPTPTLCGRIGIVLREPVPWAWRSSRDEIHMPALAARLRIRCS